MPTNYVQDGKTIEKTVTGTVSSGDVAVIGSQLGVYLNDYTSGQTGVLATEGVWNLTKPSSVSMAQGDDVYWDASADSLQAGATGADLRAGVVWETAATGTTEVPVKINAVNAKAVTVA